MWGHGPRCILTTLLRAMNNKVKLAIGILMLIVSAPLAVVLLIAMCAWRTAKAIFDEL